MATQWKSFGQPEELIQDSMYFWHQKIHITGLCKFPLCPAIVGNLETIGKQICKTNPCMTFFQRMYKSL